MIVFANAPLNLLTSEPTHLPPNLSNLQYVFNKTSRISLTSHWLSAYLTRDPKLMTLQYRQKGLSYRQVPDDLHISYDKARNTCVISQQATQKKKKKGRNTTLSDHQIDLVIHSIEADFYNWVKNCEYILRNLSLTISGDTLRHALSKEIKGRLHTDRR